MYTKKRKQKLAVPAKYMYTHNMLSSLSLPPRLPSPANPPPLTEKGQPYDLSQLSNKVVLVVNTASKCGFTPQFEGLEKLYKDIKSKYPDDFEILGFPCNQFGGQDPGTNEEIQEFCQVNYGVSFPVLGKIDVSYPSFPPPLPHGAAAIFFACAAGNTTIQDYQEIYFGMITNVRVIE